MCLSSLKKNNYKKDAVVSGWRCVRTNLKVTKWRSLYRRSRYLHLYETWLKAAGRTITYRTSPYPAGWHFFKTRKDALEYKDYHDWDIVKVKAKNIVAVGLQDELKTLVAKQIYVYKPKT